MQWFVNFRTLALVAVLLPQYAAAELRGFVDLHTHPMSNLAFGGKLIYGGLDAGSLLPADPDCQLNVRAQGVEDALGHDKSTHGGYDLFSNSCGDSVREPVIHALQRNTKGALDPSSDARGWPDFHEWPAWNDITHQKMWVDWIRRAYDGGLRVMVALATNNRTLGDATAGHGDYPTDDKSSGDLQITELKGFVDRHLDFMEIAYTSPDLARIVESNRLAIVLGVELDNIGNLMKRPLNISSWPLDVPIPNPDLPTSDDISAEIERLYNDGVRYIFPIHVIDNAFGGTAVYEDTFNYSNAHEAGWFWLLQCADTADDITYQFHPVPELIGAELAKLGGAVPAFSYDHLGPCGQRNSRALTIQGEFAVKEMMRRGMLIDIDHMSQLAANRVLDIAEAVPGGGYPVNSGHNGVRGFQGAYKTERSFTVSQYARIGRLHGMAGVGGAGMDASTWIEAYNAVVGAMGNGAIAGFGTDTNGLALGMMPQTISRDPPCVCTPNPNYAMCADACLDLDRRRVAPCLAGCRNRYPQSCSGDCGPLVSSMSTLGSRVLDYERDGVAHYGMLLDFVEAVRRLPGGASLVDNNLMHGAEYFFETWKKSELQKISISP